MRILASLVLPVLLAAAVGCSVTNRATKFSGLSDFDGKKINHFNTTNYSVEILFLRPIIGDATLERTVADFSKACKAEGAKRLRLVKSTRTNYWWILPPITWIFQYVVTDVSGDAIME